MSILPIQPQDVVPVLKEIAPKINPKTFKIALVVGAIAAYIFLFFIVFAWTRYKKQKPQVNLLPVQPPNPVDRPQPLPAPFNAAAPMPLRGLVDAFLAMPQAQRDNHAPNGGLVRHGRQPGIENLFEVANEEVVPDENRQPVQQDLIQLLEKRRLRADEIFDFFQNIPDDQRASFFEGKNLLHHLILQDHVSEELIIALLAVCPEECKLSQFAPNQEGKTPLDEALSRHLDEKIVNTVVDAYPIHDEGFFEFVYCLVEHPRFLTYDKFMKWVLDLWPDITSLSTPAQVIYLQLAPVDEFWDFVNGFDPVKFASGKIQTLLQKPVLFEPEIQELDDLMEKQAERINFHPETQEAWRRFIDEFNEGKREDFFAILDYIEEQEAPDELCDELTLELMNDPVQLPSPAGNVTVVDRSFALNLKQHPTTREPLDLNKLIPRPDVKAKIYDWMRLHALEWRRVNHKEIPEED